MPSQGETRVRYLKATQLVENPRIKQARAKNIMAQRLRDKLKKNKNKKLT